MLILSLAVTTFIGYNFGWIRGYEKKENDIDHTTREIDSLWKEVKERGL